MYQNYIFDFYGTLVDIRTDENAPFLWEKMSEIYSACGAGYAPNELKEEFRRLERQEAERIGSLYAEPDLTEVFALLYRQKKVRCDRTMARMTAITFRALSRSYLRLYDGVTELLGELRRRKKGVYLLSNAQSDFTRPEIEMVKLTGYFDGIFISAEQGCKKPSPDFFRKLLDTYRLDPRDCIMVGNDPEADIDGARALGMDCLYLHTATSPAFRGPGNATYCVPDGDFTRIRELILPQDC